MKLFKKNNLKKLPFWILLFIVVSCQEVTNEPPLVEDDNLVDDDVVNQVLGRYIVTLHSNESNSRLVGEYIDVQGAMREIVRQLLTENELDSDRSVTVYGHAISGFALELTSKEVEALQKDPNVKSIEPDRAIEDFNLRKTPPGKDKPNKGDGEMIDPSNPNSGGTIQNNAPKYLDRIDQRTLPLNGTYTYNETGQGVTAYIPLGSIWEIPEEFGDRAITIDLLGEGEELNGSTTNKALNVGGATYGPAKGLNLVGIRTLPICCDESIYLSSLLAAYDWILANGERPGIVLMGLVGPINNSSYFTAVESLYQAGFTLLSSSGAWNEDACTWASSYKPYIFTVGMANLNDMKHSSSNYGDCIDLFTTTTDWTYVNNGYFEIWRDNINMNPNFVAMGVAAGVAAKYLQNNPTAFPDEVYQFLRNTATKNVVKLSNSVNNHLLFSGMTMEGAGAIDPERINYSLDLMVSVMKARGNEYRVSFEWNPIENPSGKVDIYEDGVKIASASEEVGWGNWGYSVTGNNLSPRTYKICLSGTSDCSNEVQIEFK